jgi:HAD superfamily hydrolase (TIGR01509 family)
LGHKHGFSLSATELDQYVAAELALVTQKLSEEATECPNSTAVLEKIYHEKKYGLAVVSSSAISRVRASIHKTGQDRFFEKQHVYSAASSLPVPTTKPDPAIYIYACQQLGADPANCVAIEDSRTGATAAMRAGILVIGYVGPYEDEAEREKVRKVLQEQCNAVAVMDDWKEFEEILKRLEDM